MYIYTDTLQNASCDTHACLLLTCHQSKRASSRVIDISATYLLDCHEFSFLCSEWSRTHHEPNVNPHELSDCHVVSAQNAL